MINKTHKWFYMLLSNAMKDFRLSKAVQKKYFSKFYVNSFKRLLPKKWSFSL